MSFLLEMLGPASRAPAVLGVNSTRRVARFLLSQQNPDGGFKDRAGRSDLYYTTFGLAGLAALLAASDKLDYVDGRGVSDAFSLARDYLREFGEGDGLDFVHLCSLSRARGGLAVLELLGDRHEPNSAGLLGRVEEFRARNGGYNPARGSALGTAYGGYLAMGAYQDLGERIADDERVGASLEPLRTPDGAWTNEKHEIPKLRGATNATAAALGILRQLGAELPDAAREWLLARAHAQGGFVATPTAPLPDLLSTASALHTLTVFGTPLDSLRGKCLNFIDSLWTNAGGFHGHWGDDLLDVEYTFYGLLALGHLGPG